MVKHSGGSADKSYVAPPLHAGKPPDTDAGGQYHRALFERSLDCVYFQDFAGNYLDANPAALNLLGYTRDDAPEEGFVTQAMKKRKGGTKS